MRLHDHLCVRLFGLIALYDSCVVCIRMDVFVRGVGCARFCLLRPVSAGRVFKCGCIRMCACWLCVVVAAVCGYGDFACCVQWFVCARSCVICVQLGLPRNRVVSVVSLLVVWSCVVLCCE